MTKLRITGGRVLLHSDGEQDIDVTLDDGIIAGIGRNGSSSGKEIDATSLLVLPGIVDIHGDAFERQLQPRPGVGFDADIALHDTEAQLLANGITTAFHGVTLSWEPGLRSLTTWQALLNALEARRWTCDMRVHLRWEAFNLDALETALADIAAGRVHLVAFNDHTPAILKKIADPVAGAKYSDRAGMKLDEFRALAERIAAREHAVPAASDRIASKPACQWPAMTMPPSPRATNSATAARASVNSPWPKMLRNKPATSATGSPWVAPMSCAVAPISAGPLPQ
jgi:alpha-D-ribose 1-methylphosphonate 5-triphosphate diphosphatase